MLFNAGVDDAVRKNIDNIEALSNYAKKQYNLPNGNYMSLGLPEPKYVYDEQRVLNAIKDAEKTGRVNNYLNGVLDAPIVKKVDSPGGTLPSSGEYHCVQPNLEKVKNMNEYLDGLTDMHFMLDGKEYKIVEISDLKTKDGFSWEFGYSGVMTPDGRLDIH